MSEARISGAEEAGLDHIQLSFQDSTREMNDFLSSTRTFELKARVAALIKQHDYPMVLNVRPAPAQHRARGEILGDGRAHGRGYVELANTQYYGWAWLQSRASSCRAARSWSAPRR